jgi:BioD-like phosphotransacetylase family protein
MKRVYVAATEQHAGKTTMSLGIFKGAVERGYKACFVKPVGQRYVMAGDIRVDEDAVLFKDALGAGGDLARLSPVTIPRGFTNDYIFNRDPERIHKPILDAMASLEDEHELAVIEGTGHAGVGSVVDASNAEVAHLLDAACIIVSGGGIGRCIDEICLNRALFDALEVKLVGAIINKVYEEKYEKVSKAVRQGLANNGIRCLGVVPYRKELTYLTMRRLREELELDVLSGEEHLDNRVRDILVGAMEPQNMIRHLSDGALVVVPGDRVDNILASINTHLMRPRGSSPRIAGLLLTGGLVPQLSIVNILCEVDVPVLVTDDDTAHAAFQVRRLVPKITAPETDKVNLATRVVSERVDLDCIFSSIGLGNGKGADASGPDEMSGTTD